MRGQTAKLIRKAIYGKDGSPRFRMYFQPDSRSYTIEADHKRQMYQQSKKDYVRRDQ